MRGRWRRRRRRGRVVRLLVALVAFIVLGVACRAVQRNRQERGINPSPVPIEEGRGSAQVTVNELVAGGGRVDWSPDGSQLIFDMATEQGHYELFLSNRDGSDPRCLTCDVAGLPTGRHRGNPAWHPSGDYIVFQVEKADNPGGSRRATPGLGIANDLWLIGVDGSGLTPLTDVPVDSGTLHPHFSHDGTRLSWSQQTGEAGNLDQWDLRIADFAIIDGKGQLSNEQRYEPIAGAFHENGGFSPDDGSLIFTANEGQENELALDIYTLELASDRLTRLTGPDDEWDEHGHFSPAGQQIVWMSSLDNQWDGSTSKLATDYWIMNADGSDKQRLTHFNAAGYPESSEQRIVVGDFAWAPDGQRIAAYYIISRGLRRVFDLYNNDFYRIVEIDLTATGLSR